MKKLILATAAAIVFAGQSLAADVSGKLVIYTSQPNKDAQQTVDAFKAKHPDVEVEWIRDGTTKVMQDNPNVFGREIKAGSSAQNSVDQASGRVIRCRRGLEIVDSAGAGILDLQIGECSADIDGDTNRGFHRLGQLQTMALSGNPRPASIVVKGRC